MKNAKVLFLSIFTFIGTVSAMDLQKQSSAEDLFLTEAMQKVDNALLDAIENCDKNDGNHDFRMNELRDNSWNLSAVQLNHVLDQHAESVKNKYDQYKCDDCKQIKSFIIVGKRVLSNAIAEEKGNMTVMDLAKIEASK